MERQIAKKISSLKRHDDKKSNDCEIYKNFFRHKNGKMPGVDVEETFLDLKGLSFSIDIINVSPTVYHCPARPWLHFPRAASAGKCTKSLELMNDVSSLARSLPPASEQKIKRNPRKDSRGPSEAAKGIDLIMQ